MKPQITGEIQHSKKLLFLLDIQPKCLTLLNHTGVPIRTSFPVDI